MRILTKNEQNQLIDLNYERINAAKRAPFHKRQEMLDKIVQDINTCLLIRDSYMVDLAVLAAEQILTTDLKAVLQ